MRKKYSGDGNGRGSNLRLLGNDGRDKGKAGNVHESPTLFHIEKVLLHFVSHRTVFIKKGQYKFRRKILKEIKLSKESLKINVKWYMFSVEQSDHIY